MIDRNLVSVAIPAYNKDDWILDYTRKAIESVIKQTHRPIEIILSDDNSPNSLKALVDEKRAECGPDLEIKYYRQKENLNYYWNLQFVLSEATGKYVVQLDHDDWMIDQHYFADAIKAIEEQPNCYMSIANSFMENTPDTFLNFYYQNWRYVEGDIMMKNHLFTDSSHPSRSAVMMRLDKLKELNYKQFFISKETGQRLNTMPDEGFVKICLLAAIGKIALTGRVVSVRGVPPYSLSRSVWGGGQKMLIPYFLLYQYFARTGCLRGVQTMIINMVIRYPCENIDFKILKYLGYNRAAIMFMVLGVIWFNLTTRIFIYPFRVIRKIVVRILNKLLV
ncbi:glycosyltransferase [Candidatus Pelagibacter ubique]|nr:glycosyltransferase [Candidatus Pelagibacter ubique]